MISHIIKQLNKGEITAQDLVISSFEVMRQQEPIYNTIVTNYDKKSEEMILQNLENEKIDKKKLQGIPILVKDSIQTKSFPTYAGLNREITKDQLSISPVIEKLTNTGAIIIGKTNTPTGAMDYQTFNSKFGTTCNPYNKNLTPGGSSGGSAASVALNYTDIAIGSDFGGSLRQPASFCGVYSLKPTFSKFSAIGHLDIDYDEENNEQLTIGPISNSIDGCKLIWDVLMDNNIEISNDTNPEVESEILVSPYWKHLETDKRIVHSINEKIVKNLSLPSSAILTEIPHTEMLDLHKEFFKKLKHKESKYTFEELRNRKNVLINQIMTFFDQYDAWIVPAVSTLPYKHNPNHESITINGKSVNYWVANGSYCIPFNVLGFPVITIPLTKIDNLPVGIQVIGKPDKEVKLFEITKDLENRIKNTIQG